MIWPAERSREVLKAWREWTETAPDEVTTSARIMNIPDLEGVPDMVRGRSLVVIDGAVIGTPEEADAILAPLRALQPEIDMFGPVPPVALSYIHMDPEEPVPGIGGSTMLDDVTLELIDTLVDHFEQSPMLLLVELRHLGGALARAKHEHGALAKLDAGYVFFAAGMAPPEIADAVREQIESVTDTVEAHGNGRNYSNFAEKPETDPATFFGAATYARLRAVKSVYDPGSLFRANHEIQPAA